MPRMGTIPRSPFQVWSGDTEHSSKVADEGNDVKLSVLMPVYNEARTLRTIVRRVLDAPVDGGVELVAVDEDTDRSFEVLQELASLDNPIVVLQHPVKTGKGAAIRTAIARMTGDVAVVQDSDLEYDPAEFPLLLKPIVEDRADAVFGSRFAASPEHQVFYLALPRESDPHVVHQHPQRLEPHRHGDLLQGGAGRHPEGPTARE